MIFSHLHEDSKMFIPHLKKNEFDIGAYVNVVNAGGFLYSLICILFYVKKSRT